MLRQKSILLFCFLLLPMISGCVSNEIKNLSKGMVANFFWAVPFAALIVFTVFIMNKLIAKNGQTQDRLCSYVGITLFPVIFAGGVGIKFGFTLWPMAIAILLGAIIGWFSYTIDELFSRAWKNKKITIPAALGLIMAGYITTTIFTHVWLEGDMYVTNKACVNRVVVERYTYNYCIDKDGNDCSTYDWEYEYHVDRIAQGWELPIILESNDYKLGRGALGKKDRVRQEEYFLIGGYLFSEKRNSWNSFIWLRLYKRVPFEIGEVQQVQSNYFGNPFNNAGVVRAPKSLPETSAIILLPRADIIPPATGIGKTVEMGWTAAKLMFVKEEYRILLWLHFGLGGILLLLAIFIPPLRTPIFVFIACASIIILIILMVVAARTGGLGALSGRRRSSPGGGKFGGAGSSSNW